MNFDSCVRAPQKNVPISLSARAMKRRSGLIYVFVPRVNESRDVIMPRSLVYEHKNSVYNPRKLPSIIYHELASSDGVAAVFNHNLASISFS